MKQGALVLFAILLAAVFSGCIVLAAGAGATGVFYVKGEAKKSYPYGVLKVYNATLAALDSAKVVITSQAADETSGKIEGALADGKDVKIKLETAGTGVTEVKIRVGTFGDKGKSEFLFSKIDAKL